MSEARAMQHSVAPYLQKWVGKNALDTSKPQESALNIGYSPVKTLVCDSLTAIFTYTQAHNMHNCTKYTINHVTTLSDENLWQGFYVLSHGIMRVGESVNNDAYAKCKWDCGIYLVQQKLQHPLLPLQSITNFHYLRLTIDYAFNTREAHSHQAQSHPHFRQLLKYDTCRLLNS